MNKLSLFFSLSFICLLSPLISQDYFTAFVGSFVEVRPQDFSEIRSLGFLYTQTVDGNLNQVYLGQYSSQDRAAQVVPVLKNQGFTNARVLGANYDGGQEVAVIQIATRYSMEAVNWESLDQAGPLNVLLADGNIKILTGTFPDANSAKAELPRIRALGFSDAFVKMVNNRKILPVTSLATGIKEDLIPLNLNETQSPPPPRPSVPVQPEAMENNDELRIRSGNPTVPRPGGNAGNSSPTESTKVVEDEAHTVSTVTQKNTFALPIIRGDVKRNSVIALQEVLKTEGYYNSSIDGFYGNGTKAAFERMLTENKTVQKYLLLIPFYDDQSAQSAINPATAFFNQCPEIRLLRSIAWDLNPAALEQTADLGKAIARQNQLSQQRSALSPTESTLLDTWQHNLWRNIDRWAGIDPFLLETSQALRFAYFQSQVRIEDYFMDQGLKPNEARSLAIASLKAIAGVSLRRFE